MLQHVIKWAVFAAAWRQFKPYLWGTVFAVAAVFFITTLHGEFVDYLRLTADLLRNSESNDQSAGPPSGAWLLLSFAIKWLGYVLVAGAWWLYFRSINRQQKKSFKKTKAGVKSSSSVANANSSDDDEQQKRDDAAFDFLRGKASLQGRGDKILSRGSGDERKP